MGNNTSFGARKQDKGELPRSTPCPNAASPVMKRTKPIRIEPPLPIVVGKKDAAYAWCLRQRARRTVPALRERGKQLYYSIVPVNKQKGAISK
jgi:hypothetical protein